jgi:hypothetical protein
MTAVTKGTDSNLHVTEKLGLTLDYVVAVCTDGALSEVKVWEQ